MENLGWIVTIALTILLAISEGLAHSKRFKANSNIQLINEILSGGIKGVLVRSPGGVAASIVSKAGEYIEEKIEDKLDEPPTPILVPDPVPQVAPTPPPQPKPKPLAKPKQSQTTTGVGGEEPLRTTPGRHDVG